MKIIEPYTELWSELNTTPVQHIARCARVCYGGENKQHTFEQDQKLYASLLKRGHLSMLRHATFYYKINLPQAIELGTRWFDSEFVAKKTNRAQDLYVSCNHQYYLEHHPNAVEEGLSTSEFLSKCVEYPELFEIFRLTFYLTTQIATSRELNRVSVNNIAERSTRYCVSKNGITICRPHWFDPANLDVGDLTNEQVMAAAWEKDEHTYNILLKRGMAPEDIRGSLPLETATKVVYTYTIGEWQHIIGNRYYGLTGKPQPDARLIIGMVRDQINDFAREHNIMYAI